MGSSDTTSTMLAWLFLIAAFMGWLAPIFIAAVRGKSNVGGIAIIDIFLGWTVVGWIIALVMACAAEQRKEPPLREYPLPPPPGYGDNWY